MRKTRVLETVLTVAVMADRSARPYGDAVTPDEMVADLRQCIRLNLDCADICLAAGSMGSRRTGSNETGLVAALVACAAACGLCAEECAKHATEHERAKFL